MKGYGVRDVKTKEPVDENTLFMIASNSKLFTGTAIAAARIRATNSRSMIRSHKYFPRLHAVR